MQWQVVREKRDKPLGAEHFWREAARTMMLWEMMMKMVMMMVNEPAARVWYWRRDTGTGRVI